MKQKIFTFMPGGNTPVEKQFELFRHHCGEIAKRVRERPRCHKCFTHGWVGGNWQINHGCDGCAEMHDFIHAARDAFANEAIESGKGVLHG